jgi:hypothetical protein
LHCGFVLRANRQRCGSVSHLRTGVKSFLRVFVRSVVWIKTARALRNFFCRRYLLRNLPMGVNLLFKYLLVDSLFSTCQLGLSVLSASIVADSSESLIVDARPGFDAPSAPFLA